MILEETAVVVLAGFTVKTCTLDSPPPGAGLKTVMLNVPAEVKSLNRMEAFNWFALAKIVARSDPANLTKESETKFDPLTVRVNAGSPTVLLSGDRLLMAGIILIPVPVNPIPKVGVLGSLETILKVVDFVPVEIGEKVAVIVQLPPAVMVGVKLGHVPATTLNIPESPPVNPMELTTRSAVPVLEMVKI